jgi:hypothetical protein
MPYIVVLHIVTKYVNVSTASDPMHTVVLSCSVRHTSVFVMRSGEPFKRRAESAEGVLGDWESIVLSPRQDERNCGIKGAPPTPGARKLNGVPLHFPRTVCILPFAFTAAGIRVHFGLHRVHPEEEGECNAASSQRPWRRGKTLRRCTALHVPCCDSSFLLPV